MCVQTQQQHMAAIRPNGLWTISEILDCSRKYLPECLINVAWYLIGFPLRILYFNGPSLAGLGFWEGRSGEDICSQLTNVDASFWIFGDDRKQACLDIIDRKFYGFAVTMGTIIYFVFIYWAIFACIRCSLTKINRIKDSR